MTTAVITIVSGRHEHLARQIAAIDPATDHILVAMNDPKIAEMYPHLQAIHLSTAPTLPLAEARNLGARTAIEKGADLLVFLDVDCIPMPGMIARFEAGPRETLLTGAVGYLPKNSLQASDATFHSFRPRPAPGEIIVGDPLLFWSLSFACTAAVWTRIGGFDEMYRGYGGEDTDLALRAQSAGVEVAWVGGAEALHQFHPTQSPPTEHLDDILRNGALFADRWGFWPMRGWLDEFEQLGLVSQGADGSYSRKDRA